MEKEILELLKTMQGNINTMQANINAIQGDISSMKDDIKRLDNKIDNLDTKVDNRFDELASEIGDLVSKDIATGISNQIKDVKQDVEFLTHKTTETEKDVYKIQSHLKLIK